MIWKISKVCLEENCELLPDVVDTSLWDALNPDKISQSKKTDRQVARLYSAIRSRENYFQENTPTAFGNPEYSRCCGMVSGFLQALEFTETEEDGKIIIHNSKNKIVLIIDKLKLPQSYFECQKDINKTLRELGLR